MTNYSSLLAFYQKNDFNPVLIELDNDEKWRLHFHKRENLYSHHLKIPFGLLRDKRILEFGCNSGENALVAASAGARLTLVEPNTAVHGRLHELFDQYGLQKQIDRMITSTIEDFTTEEKFDVVIAEGFLNSIDNRDNALKKIAEFVRPGGFLVTSFDDRYGSLIEYVKQAILYRACQLDNVTDMQGEASLAMAERLFRNGYSRLSASRAFRAWWKDQLVNPYFISQYMWSFQEIFQTLHNTKMSYHSSSPRWDMTDHYRWYKDTENTAREFEEILRQWRNNFLYILTGNPSKDSDSLAAPDRVIVDCANFIDSVSRFVIDYPSQAFNLELPESLFQYAVASGNRTTIQLFTEVKELLEASRNQDLDTILHTYHKSEILKDTWGTAYHYLCLKKQW